MANKIDCFMQHNLRKIKNGVTRRQYQRACDDFFKYVMEHEKRRLLPKKYVETVQAYVDSLYARGLSADSVHTYAVGVTQGLGLSLTDIELKKRRRPQKGRESEEKTGTAWYDFTGIRKTEIGCLKGADLIDKNGDTYLVVRKGKGGKRQEQRILPQYVEVIKKAFDDVAPEAYVLTKDERTALNHQHLHAQRRRIAREAYAIYESMTPEERAPLLAECHERFLHKYDRKYDAHKARIEGELLWRREVRMIKKRPLIVCRGANAESLKAQGRPISFEREATLMVSVLHLAHYRTDVTIKNYFV